nr:hypothetical protein [Micromonospora sp. 4G55]
MTLRRGLHPTAHHARPPGGLGGRSALSTTSSNGPGRLPPRGANAQNWLPSGSASTHQLISASGSRTSRAPAARSAAGSASASRRSRWTRVLPVRGSGTRLTQIDSGPAPARPRVDPEVAVAGVEHLATEDPGPEPGQRAGVRGVHAEILEARDHPVIMPAGPDNAPPRRRPGQVSGGRA